MDDLISRQAAIDAINALHEKPNAWLDYAVDAIMTLPSAQPDTVPVVHGFWRAHTMSEVTGYDPTLSGIDPVCSYSCSVCGEDCYVSDTGDDILSKYCPFCGARMKGEG